MFTCFVLVNHLESRSGDVVMMIKIFLVHWCCSKWPSLLCCASTAPQQSHLLTATLIYLPPCARVNQRRDTWETRVVITCPIVLHQSMISISVHAASKYQIFYPVGYDPISKGNPAHCVASIHDINCSPCCPMVSSHQQSKSSPLCCINPWYQLQSMLRPNFRFFTPWGKFPSAKEIQQVRERAVSATVNDACKTIL